MKFDPISFSGKTCLVEKTIKGAILRGELRPGQKINQEEIAEQLGVSRTPMREALRKLEAEGFVRIEPCVGTIVLGLDTEEVKEIYVIRIKLEGLAARLAVEGAEKSDVDLLIDIVNLKKHMQEDDHEEILQLNRKFHQSIYRLCGNRRLIKILDGLWENIDRCRVETMPLILRQSDEEHEAILEAFLKGDGLLAEARMQSHLENAFQVLLKKLEG